MSSVDVMGFFLPAFIAGVLGVELAIAVVLAALVEVVVELVLLMKFVFMVLIVEAWNKVERYLYLMFTLYCSKEFS